MDCDGIESIELIFDQRKPECTIELQVDDRVWTIQFLSDINNINNRDQ
jgi:hypothetical protein